MTINTNPLPLGQPTILAVPGEAKLKISSQSNANYHQRVKVTDIDDGKTYVFEGNGEAAAMKDKAGSDHIDLPPLRNGKLRRLSILAENSSTGPSGPFGHLMSSDQRLSLYTGDFNVKSLAWEVASEDGGDDDYNGLDPSCRCIRSSMRYHSLIIDALASPNLPAQMREPKRLMNEGFSMVIGGTETTARSLALGTYYLLANETIRRKVREELRQVMPTPDARPSWSQLEQLPYLSAVVSDTLRLSIGIASRSPRVAPTEALVYRDYVIPPGTPVSEIHYFILTDPDIFPDPHVFDPERWIRAAARGQRLDRYLVNISRGSRICVGKNLAYAELFLFFAMLVRRFDMKLYETSEKNIEFARDFGTPYPDNGNLSVRAIVTGIVKE